MEIIKLNGKPIKPNTVAAIGFFDGVHKAHRALLEKTISVGRKRHKQTAVITFDVHPKTVLFDLDYRYITPLDKKIALIEEYGIDTLYLLEFNKEKASLTPLEFIEKYMQSLDVLVCGFDFKFGVRGSGNIKMLQNCNKFETIVVDEITQDGYKVGSSHIRDLIQAGQMDKIPSVMGRYYTINGKVIHGNKNGHILGYPTANIDSNQFLVPKTGVYITKSFVLGSWRESVTSIGHNPTVNCRINESIETYIFDFDNQIYNQIITIKFIKRIREEIKFDNIDQLIKQIAKDVEEAKLYFSKYKK